MAHYRKIDVSIWNDEKFSSLNVAGKLSFVFLMTHPNMTGIGAMRATLPGLSAELGVPQKEISEVFKSELVVFSAEESCVFIPNFIKYQGCESLNVLKSWVNQIQFIPHGSVKDMALSTLVSFIEGKSEAFRLAFSEAYRKAYGKDYALGKGLALALGKEQGKAYPVSSKQLGKPAIEVKDYAQGENANDSQMPPEVIRVDGKWREVDANGEVAA